MTARSGNTAAVQKLQSLLQGKVLADDTSLTKFSYDYSIYEIRPLAVVQPYDLEDLRKVILFAAAEGFHITPRGGGSGTAGGALGREIIIALPHGGFWGQVEDFSIQDASASISTRAGMLHNDLQHYLKKQAYFLPADVSSARISQIGGNVATKASGPHALKYGSIDRFLEDIEFFTSQGELVNTSDKSSIPRRIQDKLKRLSHHILTENSMRNALDTKRFMKTSSGYNLFAFIQGLTMEKLLAQLFAGSNGTLGYITRVTLRAEPYETARAAMLLYFADLVEAGRAVCAIRDLGVAAIEIISKETATLMIRKGLRNKLLDKESHILFIEFDGAERSAQITAVKQILRHEGVALSRDAVVATDEADIARLWKLRKQILPLISNPGPHLKALAVVNDVGVDPRYLADFIADLQKIFRKHGVESFIYGHAGSGNLHLRPIFDMTRGGLPKRIRQLADEVYGTVLHYNGTISGEHGIGRLKAPYLKQEWGGKLYSSMREVKKIFDPDGIFNPGVMFSDRSITDNLRHDLQR
jgi:FAD/FMN-containing dehydrogenase